ncbi:hypothetical protein [Spiroplasma endosymbiont of Amphimallon solstitiale]|uniref:hypothetical protein n=1 Tax=Spiroplasma endosymbiont of Amphimallon solstitiale TaxID=3066288 RepID=UPI00313E2CE2
MINLKKIKLTENNNRFGGKTKKWKNNKGELEYKTEIRNKSNELDSLIFMNRIWQFMTKTKIILNVELKELPFQIVKLFLKYF